jgi:hypothetical protein
VGEALISHRGTVASTEEFRRSDVVLKLVVNGEHEVLEAHHCLGTENTGESNTPLLVMKTSFRE